MLLGAVWFRCRSLENIPGINGDEAWYGARAMAILHGQERLLVATPTGNPPNFLFLVPTILLHLVFRPSIVLLRSVAVAGGLAALLLNWYLCRWVFDGRTAAISTLALAVLPVNIAYSRFAWDASQSLAATLPVLYFSLAAVRFPRHGGRMLIAAAAAQIVAFWVHPTNILICPAIAAAAIAAAPWREFRRRGIGNLLRRRTTWGAALLGILIAAAAVPWLHGSAFPRAAQRMAQVQQLFNVPNMVRCAALYPRLLTGESIYRYIPGTHSWLLWPAVEDTNHWGIDVILVWGCLAAAVAILWPQRDAEHAAPDRVLLSAWALVLAAFLMLAGTPALTPGYERFALSLVAPTILLAARGAARLAAKSPAWNVAVPLAATILGWTLLADFQRHYFDFQEQTGGNSHLAFRTGPIEPKHAALASILRQRVAGDVWIVAGQWWNYWPLRYLAAAEPGLHVVTPLQSAALPTDAAIVQGRAWYVEFCGTEELAQAESRLKGRTVVRQDFPDFAGRPVLRLLYPQ